MSTDARVDVYGLVDLSIAPQCEHPDHHDPDWHGGDARYVIAADCACGRHELFLLCAPAWVDVGVNGLQCLRCGVVRERDGLWRVVSVL